jgi:hypothetical protein
MIPIPQPAPCRIYIVQLRRRQDPLHCHVL